MPTALQLNTTLRRVLECLLVGLCLLGTVAAQPMDTLKPATVIPVPGGSRLDADEEGNVVVTDWSNHRLYRFLRAYRYDSVQKVGGFGLTGEGLFHPGKVQYLNRQELYLHDEGNRRLVLLTTTLLFLREIDFDTQPIRATISGAGASDALYLNPISFALAPSGELYVLNQEDATVYRFDVFGRYELSFGGKDYGMGRLVKPNDIYVSAQREIWVSDSVSQRLACFDAFGTYQFSIVGNRLPAGFRRVVAGLPNGGLLLLTREGLWVWRKGQLSVLPLAGLPTGGPSVIRDAVLQAGTLYLLTENAVLLYTIAQP